MGAVANGFAMIGAVIAVGVLLAHVGLVDGSGQAVLAKLAFYVANPALLLTVLADTDLHVVFSSTLAAIVAAIAVTAGLFGAYARWRRLDVGSSVVGMLASGYANASNLGIPIATYVLGDPAFAAPLLILQLLVLQPLAVTVLDAATRPTRSPLARALSGPLRNPLTVGSAMGVVIGLLEIELPSAALHPLEVLGAMAVPCMLLAFGISLRLGPLPGRNSPGVLAAVALKLVVQPAAAYLVGSLVLGIEGHALLVATVLSALPAAQNVFIIASRYNRATVLARDAIFVSTLGSVPVITVISALLG